MSRTFDVLYIGWSQARGIWGDKFVLPVFHHIFNSRQNQGKFEPEKLRISVAKTDLRIIKEIPTKTSVRTFVDYPNISLADIAFANKVCYNGIFYTCLLVLGYDPQTGIPVHLYVYQMKTEDEAMRFIHLILRKTKKSENKRRLLDIEKMLIEKNQIEESQLKNSEDVSNSSFSSLSKSNSLSQSSSNDDSQMGNSKIMTLKSPEENRPESTSQSRPSKLSSSKSLLLPPRDYETTHMRPRKISSDNYKPNIPSRVQHFPKMNNM